MQWSRPNLHEIFMMQSLKFLIILWFINYRSATSLFTEPLLVVSWGDRLAAVAAVGVKRQFRWKWGPAGSDRSLSSLISCSLSSSTCCKTLWYSLSFSSSCSNSLGSRQVGQRRFFWYFINRQNKMSNETNNYKSHLLVSSFILPSSMLTRCALWDSCETVELSVLTPEVATVSSWGATGGARLCWVEFLSGSASSSMSSWSAASLSEARLKWGLSSEHTHTHAGMLL